MQLSRSAFVAVVVSVMCVIGCDGPERTVAPAARPSADFGVMPNPNPTTAGDFYTLTDISGGVTSAALDINNHDWVVGSHSVGAATHGFIRHPNGAIEDIPPLPGDVSNSVTAINDSNEIVGISVGKDGTNHPWARSTGKAMQKLAIYGCGTHARANAIDDDGEIAGQCDGLPTIWGTQFTFPFIESNIPGELLDIAALARPVGRLDFPDGTKGAVMFGGTASGIGAPRLPSGTTNSWVYGTNGSHDMVGEYDDAAGAHGFRATSLTSTMTLPHPVRGISGPGRMVGWYVGIPAVAYTIAPNGIVLERPLPPSNVSRVAVRVNRCGSIVGHYFPSGIVGNPRAALWTKPTCD